MNEFHVSFHEETASFPVKFIEAKLKPEQKKSATPSKEQQKVTPDEGFVLSEVTVEPIPPEYIIPELQERIATPTKQQQTIDPQEGYDALSRVIVEPIPPEYIVPSDKITLRENATNVDISQYATADIAVPAERMPILIDTIDISDFAEPVNRVNIDMSQYSFDEFDIIYLELDEITSSKMDWLYLACGPITGTYFGSAGAWTWEFEKVFFVKLNPNEWRNMIHRLNNYPTTGDDIGLGNISFYFYYNDTTFTKGRISIYAI